jgi:hypothetical protein
MRDGQSRFRVLGAQLYITRPTDKDAVGRLIEVMVIDYLNRRHLRVVVSGSRVTEVRDLDWQPAFSAEEIAEAEAIVARDQRLKKHIGRSGVFASVFSVGGSTPGERRIGLRYLLSQKTAAQLIAEVEIDLVKQELIAATTSGPQGDSYG